jgi:hypothetical protein
MQDERPRVWVGHVMLHTVDIRGTRDFMLKLGMRAIADGEDFAVLELRGGTHLLLLRAKSRFAEPAYFDLMVDDLEATHEQLRSLGLAPSAIEAGDIHSSFTIVSPSGHTITFNSTHVSDQPV